MAKKPNLMPTEPKPPPPPDPPPLAEQVKIYDVKTQEGASVHFQIDGITIPGVVEHRVYQPLSGIPRVTFTIAARNVHVEIRAGLKTGYVHHQDGATDKPDDD